MRVCAACSGDHFIVGLQTFCDCGPFDGQALSFSLPMLGVELACEAVWHVDRRAATIVLGPPEQPISVRINGTAHE